MKIQSISGFGLPCNNKNQKKNPLFSHVNFEGSLTVKQLKKFPLEKKLTHMFDNCSTGDLVVVGKSFQEIHKGLTKAIENFNEVIKRILFIKHGGISVPLAFGKDSDEELACVNIGNKKILISTDDIVEDLEPNDSIMLDEGDVIINNDVNIPIGMFADYDKYIEDNDDMDLITNPENFATEIFDLEDIQQKRISQANKAALALIEDKNTAFEDKITSSKKLSFKDVGGIDKTVEELKKSILYPIKFPFAYENVDLNRGIILYGKPGTGKTLVAEALAGESDATFIKLSGTEFESKWVGETESKWRELFANAREKQPSIIFIDEFDAIVKERGRSSGSDYGDKVVNQILSLMSDLEKGNDNVFVIATTNKVDSIDSAIKRSGRFGKQIEIPVPDKNGLKSIFEIHTRKKAIDPNFDKEAYIDKLKERQFTGADIKHVVNEAHTNSWIRADVYEKMEAGTLSREDMAEINIQEEDFMQALSDWDQKQTTKIRKPLGYVR